MCVHSRLEDKLVQPFEEGILIDALNCNLHKAQGHEGKIYGTGTTNGS